MKNLLLICIILSIIIISCNQSDDDSNGKSKGLKGYVNYFKDEAFSGAKYFDFGPSNRDTLQIDAAIRKRVVYFRIYGYVESSKWVRDSVLFYKYSHDTLTLKLGQIISGCEDWDKFWLKDVQIHKDSLSLVVLPHNIDEGDTLADGSHAFCKSMNYYNLYVQLVNIRKKPRIIMVGSTIYNMAKEK
jgi:hypothetical protein